MLALIQKALLLLALEIAKARHLPSRTLSFGVMNADDVLRRIGEQKPRVVYVAGKTCTGKTTFARHIESVNGYTSVGLDEVAIESVMTPLGLPNRGAMFDELYRTRSQPDWINRFVRAVHDRIDPEEFVVVEGALANVETLVEVFGKYEDFEFIYLHPIDLQNYRRNLLTRFQLSGTDAPPMLPPRFWSFINERELEIFHHTRELTSSLRESIDAYALSSQSESVKRLALFQTKFPNLTVVNV